MKNNKDHEIRSISTASEESVLISNQNDKQPIRSEFIRERMVKFNTDDESKLDITQIDQYSNRNAVSIDYVRNKMIFVFFL